MRCSKLTGFLIVSLFLTIQVTNAVKWHFPNAINIPSNTKVHFGDYWIQTIDSPIQITKWFEDDWVNYTATGGTQQVYNGSKPYAVFFDNVPQIEDATWSYTDGTVTITPSGTDVAIAYAGVGASPDLAEVVFKTSSNNAQFGFEESVNIGSGRDFYFYKVEVNSTHLWLDKTYSTKHYTRYCIYVSSPNDVQFIVDSWFPTGNSTAQLTINSPIGTNIYLRLYSPNLISASATGVVSYNWMSANQTLAMTSNSNVDPIVISTTVSETEEENVEPENYDVIITDMEGCGNWVFSEESYYTFQAQYWDGDGYAEIAVCKIAFTDGVAWVNVSYTTATSQYALESGSDIARIQSGTVTIQDANLLQVTFSIYFTNLILDAYDVDIYMYCIDSSGDIDDWEVIAEDYFNIYNLGGHSILTSNGNAGRLEGGDVFDLYAYPNNSWAQATMSFRYLQHIKMLPMIQIKRPEEWEGNQTVTYFIDYCTDTNDWITGWSLTLRPGHSYITDPVIESVYWNFSAEWRNRGTLIKNQSFSTFCSYDTTGEPENFTVTAQLWIDLWFNNQNGSSIIAGRVNSYYFPMEDDSNTWLRWWTGNDWGIIEGLRKQSMFFDTLKDNNDQTLHTQQIKLVRIGCRLNASEALGNYSVLLTDYDVFDLTIGGSPFEGVQTPVFDETKVPVMPQGGFLGTLASAFLGAINWLGNNIVYGGLNLWGNFVGFMDTIAAWLGFPGGFSTLIATITTFWAWLTTSLSHLTSMLVSTFSFLATFMTKLINTVSNAVGIFTDMINQFFFMIGTGYGYSIGLWELVGMQWWIMLFFILYPLFLLGMWEERGLDAVISHINGVKDVFAFIGSIFIRVIQLTLNIIGRIIESIPVVE